MSFSMSLGFNQKQSQKQTQRLIMSPQMQQAIHLLQMPILELSTAIDTEMEQNPVLEYALDDLEKDSDEERMEEDCEELSDDAGDRLEEELSIEDGDFEIMRHLEEEFRDHFAESEGPPRQATSEESQLQTFLESSIQGVSSLYDFLCSQAREEFSTPLTLEMAETLIGHIDERGFLEGDLREIALIHDFEEEALAGVLAKIQTFEPFGIGARDLQDCLLIQLRCQKRQYTLAYAIIDAHFDDLVHNRIPLISKELECTPTEIQTAVKNIISHLDTRPGSSYSALPPHYIEPDVAIEADGRSLKVVVNDDSLPPLRLNRKYMRLLEDTGLDDSTRDYVQKKAMSGRWLLKNIHQRNETLKRITTSLAKHQESFFLDPQGDLKPLTMKTVAEELGIHESTVARGVANKYVDSPRGLLPLRSFFTNSSVVRDGEDVSSDSVKKVLKEFIDQEDRQKPLSDEAISKRLGERGIQCARRTVAKYRREMNIGNTAQRRSYSDS